MGFNFGGHTQRPGTNGGISLPPVTWKFLRWVVIVVGILLTLLVLFVARGVYTNWLWFNHLGYSEVYITILTTRLWMFLIGVSVMGLLLGGNLYIADRFSKGPVSIPVPQQTIIWIRRLTIGGIVVVSGVISVAFGAVASGWWETMLLFVNGVSFDLVDPLYSNDVSFYVFTVPMMHLVQGWLLGAVLVLMLTSLAVYFVNFSLRGMRFNLIYPMRVHLSVLGGLLMCTIAGAHYLDTYELLLSPDGLIAGATYADINARRPALILLTIIAGLSGALIWGSIYLNSVARAARLVVGAVGLWAIGGVLAGIVYPSMIQRFAVDPNEFDREEANIKRNISWTRAGFLLDGIDSRVFPVQQEVTAEAMLSNPETMRNIRLWDHTPLRDVYNQIQHLRLYYDFLDVDVDRYTVNGEYRQVMLAARELIPDKLPEEAQRWVPRTLTYTHGYGVVMSPVTEFTPEGRPEFFVKDIPPMGDLAVTRPEIYYGESQEGFVIVNSNTPEFDRPATEQESEDVPVYATYSGDGGVRLSSFIRRLCYAVEFADVNVLISGQIKPESRIQYHRNIQDRVSVVAPFLRLDEDPYLVVDQGRLFWIQDAYTVTDRFPYSKRFDDDFNYIRNSVKVVVDAYDGTMDLFAFEPTDPLILTYSKIFPGLFRPSDAMSPGLMSHVRYPEGLFLTQANLLLQYHMIDPKQFFGKEDQWDIPQEVVFGDSAQVEPYYINMKLPGEERAEFVLILPFAPANKPNLAGWLAARSDAPNYGQLVAFTFPKDRQVFGPQQIEARIDNDPEIAQQFTLWEGAGSTVIRGNLLVVPLADTILYVEPVYIQAEKLKLPELKRVILASGDRVVWAPTLEESQLKLLRTVTRPESLLALLLDVVGEEGGLSETTQRLSGELDTGQDVELLKVNLNALKEALGDLGKDFSDVVNQLNQALQELEGLGKGSPQ